MCRRSRDFAPFISEIRNHEQDIQDYLKGTMKAPKGRETIFPSGVLILRVESTSGTGSILRVGRGLT